MSGFMGKTKQMPTVDNNTQDAHNALLGYITSQGFGGLNPQATMDPQAMKMYQALFDQNLNQALGRAKESAGNLTGSGLGNYLGNAAQRATVEQNSFLAQLMEQRRQADANRFLQLVLGGINSPAGQVQNVYQPGILDSAFQGAAAAAPFFVGAPKTINNFGGAPAASRGATNFTGEDRGYAPWQMGG